MKLITLTLILACVFNINAQFSSDLVLQLHSGTQVEMNTMNNAIDKTKLFYNTTDNNIYYNNGTLWVAAGKDIIKDSWSNDVVNNQLELKTKSDGITIRDVATKFIITDDGKVGIGTDNPSLSKIQIEGNDLFEGMFRMINTGANGANFFMGSTQDNWDIGTNKFIFGFGTPTSDRTKMIIHNNGNVGIGNSASNPASSLEVSYSHTGLTLDGVTRTTWPTNSDVGAFIDGGDKAHYINSVSIGTNNPPPSKLYVHGPIQTKASQYSGNYGITLFNSDISGVNEIYFNDLGEGVSWTSTGSISANTKVQIRATDTAPTSHFIISTNLNGNQGNVGIRTTTPDEGFEIEFGDVNKDFEIGLGTTDTDVTFFTLRSPNGTKFYITVASDGSLSASTSKP